MKKITAIVSVFVILIHCFQEFVYVSPSPLFYGNQVREESSGGRNLKQEQEHAHEVHCSRERSRAAWKVIEEYLTPFVERENYQLSRQCRLHPENDMFRDQEEHKIFIDRHEWQCGYCKKSFREEKFLDQHFDNRHYDLLNLSHGKCLADLCGALHCDAVTNSKSSRSKCNPAAAARNRHLCEVAFIIFFPFALTVHCSSTVLSNPYALFDFVKSLADSCFPISEGPSAGRLHELFLHQFCDAHTCSGKHKPFSRGGKDQGSFFRLAAGALILVLLPVFYLFLYLVQSDMKGRTQELRRISKAGWKSKPS